MFMLQESVKSATLVMSEQMYIIHILEMSSMQLWNLKQYM